MGTTVKYQSRQREKTENGIRTTMTYQGTYDDILEKQKTMLIGDVDPDYGELQKSNLHQTGPAIWNLELEYIQDSLGVDVVLRPNTRIGAKQSSCVTSTFQLALEKNTNYRTKWNYYLFAAPGISVIPSFWDTARNTIMTDENAEKYAWGKDIGDAPRGSSGVPWKVLKEPTKPGVTGYGYPTATVTELIRCRSPKHAESVINRKLNKIGFPENFSGVVNAVNWLCDSVRVSFNGTCWVAELTWTASGDADGWDRELYGG